jgi:hypothetical protein
VPNGSATSHLLAAPDHDALTGSMIVAVLAA